MTATGMTKAAQKRHPVADAGESAASTITLVIRELGQHDGAVQASDLADQVWEQARKNPEMLALLGECSLSEALADAVAEGQVTVTLGKDGVLSFRIAKDT